MREGGADGRGGACVWDTPRVAELYKLSAVSKNFLSLFFTKLQQPREREKVSRQTGSYSLLEIFLTDVHLFTYFY